MLQDKTATGNLTYALNGKDRNTGTIEGTINEDLLIADYHFQSEGQQSTRQVVFKKSGDTYMEGYGPIKEGGHRQAFENPETLQYNKAFPLKETNCTD
jgi:hypothetical protein